MDDQLSAAEGELPPATRDQEREPCRRPAHAAHRHRHGARLAMIFFALYMLALCLPIALFAVISIVDDHKKAPQKAPKPHRAPTPRGALQHRQSLAPASDALIAV